MHRASLIAIVMVSLAMRLVNCSATSCLSCFGGKLRYDTVDIISSNVKHFQQDMQLATQDADRHLDSGSTLSSTSSALRSYVKSKKRDVNSREAIQGVDRGLSVLAAKTVLALEELVSAKKLDCNDEMFQLVRIARANSLQLDPSRPLKRFVDHYSKVYVDNCHSSHLEAIKSVKVADETLTDVDKLMENVIEETSGRKVTELSDREFAIALWEYRLPRSQTNEPIGRALYKTLIELGGDEAKRELHEGDSSAVRTQLHLLARPCWDLKYALDAPTSVLQQDFEISPQSLSTADPGLLKLLGLNLACQEFWRYMSDKLSCLKSHVSSLDSPAGGI